MAEYDGEKSQDATPHRRQQAREEGQVAKSQDLGSAALLVLGLLALLMFGGGLVEFVVRYCRQQLGGEAWLATDPAPPPSTPTRRSGDWAANLLPLFGLLVAAGVAVNVAQIGFLFLPEKLVPDITRLDPLQGMKRIVSLQGVMRLAFGLVKLAIVATVALASLYNQREAIVGLSAMGVGQIALFLTQILIWTGVKIGGALLVLSILDYGFQWWKHEPRSADDAAGNARGDEEPRG